MSRLLFLLTVLSSFLLSLSVRAETLNGPVSIQGWDIYYTQGKSWLDIAGKFTGLGPFDPVAVGFNTNDGSGYLTGVPQGAQFYIPWPLDQELASSFAHDWYYNGSYPNDAVKIPNDQPPYATNKLSPFFAWILDPETNRVYWEAYTEGGEPAPPGFTDVTNTNYNFAVAVEPLSQ